MEIHPNVALGRLRAGKPALGFGVTHNRSVAAAHIAKAAGYHWIVIDLEHGVATLAEAAQLCMAASAIGVAPIVRIGRDAFGDASRLLDNGAQGVLVPDVRDASEARRAVQALRYPPSGERPWGANAFPFGYRPPPIDQAMPAVDRQTLIAVMIESAQAVQAADEIAAVPGVDVLFAGVSDLGSSLGIPGRPAEPEMLAAVEQIANACRRADKVLGVGGTQDADAILHFIQMGARFIAGGNDHQFVLAAATEKARHLEKLLAEAQV
jgi:2-keto-3-deoxy-L-rhamnonate aldolase RhmA